MKLTTLLFASIAIIAGLMALNQYSTLQSAESTAIESSKESTNALAQTVVSIMERRLTLRIEQFKLISTDEGISTLLERSNKEFEQIDFAALIDQRDSEWVLGKNNELVQELLQNPISQKFYTLSTEGQKQYSRAIAEIFVTNKYGAVAALSEKTTDYGQNDEIWWQEAMKNKIYISDITYDLSAQKHTTEIAIRIDSDEPLGVLKILLDLKDFTDVIDTIISYFPQGSVITLIDKDGSIIHSTKPHSFMQKIPGTLFSDIKKTRPTNTIYENSLMSFGYTRKGSTLEPADWTVIVERPLETLSPDLIKLHTKLTLLTLLALAIITIAGISIHYTITKPLHTISSNVDQISKGNFKIAIPEKYSSTELTELAQSLRRILISLKIAVQRVGIPKEEIFVQMEKQQKMVTGMKEHISILEKCVDISARTMMLVDYKDQKPRIVKINKTFTEIYGYTEKEVLGKNPNMISSKKQSKQYYQKMWKTLLDPKKGTWEGAIVNKRKDGKLVSVMLIVNTIFDEQKKPVYFLGTHLDLSPAKEEYFTQKLFEQTPGMYFVFDEKGIVQQVNKHGARHLGYDDQELVGRNVLDLFHPEDRKAVRETLKKALRNPNKIYSANFRKQTKQGKTIYVHELLRTIKEKNKTQVLMFGEDVTKTV
ncbi:PAS domain S-box protein [Candidatus Woesearchaeota archaeon]|nr:PAS domain S-box protein [Candidatus Woesearchaeota archaeon]